MSPTKAWICLDNSLIMIGMSLGRLLIVTCCYICIYTKIYIYIYMCVTQALWDVMSLSRVSQGKKTTPSHLNDTHWLPWISMSHNNPFNSNVWIMYLCLCRKNSTTASKCCFVMFIFIAPASCSICLFLASSFSNLIPGLVSQLPHPACVWEECTDTEHSCVTQRISRWLYNKYTNQKQ